MALAAALHAVPAAAEAGELGRVESAHKDKDKDSSSGGSSSSSSSSSKRSRGGSILGNILGGILSSMLSSSSSRTEDGAPADPPRALAMYSYADDEPSAYADQRGPDTRMPRYGELSLSGFSTITSNIRALDTQLNVFLSAFTMHAALTRYYEPDARDVRTLDLLRLQIGLNVLHGWVNGAELHITGGVLGLHGNEWTPAGSGRADLRLYPFRPFTFDTVFDASFFAHGPPLFEAQALPGATFARLDLRLGVAMLYQSGVAPIVGPRLQVGIRF
ncbi:hypothetical protein BH11MYX4_BH11MYX4_28840 [soil metagenome]